MSSGDQRSLAPPSSRGGANGLAPSLSSTLNNESGSGEINRSLSYEDSEENDTVKQLEALNAQLAVENRIKEGAVNFLLMPLDDKLRLQVESELEMANSKIEDIKKRIEREPESSRDARKKSNGAGSATPAKRKFPNQTPVSAKIREETDERDDFRTTLQNAMTCLKTLISLGKSSPTSPLHSPLASSSAHPHSVNESEVDRARIERMSELVKILQRSVRVRYELNIAEIVKAALPGLSDKSSKRCRASSYRLIRHGLVDSESVKRLADQHLDWYIVRTLTRDNKYAIEKEQALKLIRTIIEIGPDRRGSPTSTAAKVPLSEPLMRAIIAVAEHAEDPFRPICAQILAEILMIDIDLVARTGGIRFLLHALGEGPVEIGPLLAAMFLHIIDSPRTRAYLRVGVDLELALSAVTDAYGKGPEHPDRMRGCAKVIQLILRTWSGLMYLCMDDMLAIRSIVDTLRIPSLDTREIVLDMFFELFNIKTPEWYKTFIDGRRLTMYRRSRQPSENKKSSEAHDRPQQTLKLTDQYIGLLLLVFTNAGIIDALTEMLEEFKTGSNLSRKATLLMAEILQMSNRVLPLSVAAKIQTIPRIFNLASDYGEGENRIVGTLALSAIDSFNRNRTRLQNTAPKDSRPRANSVEDAIRRGHRQVEQVKLKMSMQMDDKTFQASLIETQVMLTKDYSKWNFDTLHELIEGPLLNSKRMEEAIKVSRFIRRLLSFFDPFNHRFSDMPRIKANLKWVRLGCSLLTTLLASQDGVRYLSTEDVFLVQIVKGFAQLDPFNGTPDSDPIFSKRRVSDTLTYGYFEMLGVLSKHKEGVELLEKFKIFTAFYHLSELRSREDLIKGIVENLDYSIDGHPRIILSKTLTSSYKHIRIYATRHLGSLIRGSVNANAWTLRLLLTQLYDPSLEVCELAVQFLQEACEDKDILQVVVEMQPTMDHLGEIGHPLLLKFMSTQMGFRYLYDAGYIDREMNTWFHERNLDYVVQVEVFLAKVFSSKSPGDGEDNLAFDGTVPPHFYGEMSKTELGCQVLQEKGHFADFAHFIRQHGLESEDAEVIMKLKSILWAVGNVGATDGGLPFLEEEEIIPAVLEIAEKSLIPSLRGTCFFVLGLISATSQGAEILDDYQWEATLSPLGLPTGLCIPVDVKKFVSIPPWNPVLNLDDAESRLIPATSETELELLTAIQNLANTVIANAASRSLARMKSRPEYRNAFSSPSVLFRALHIISTQRYRLPVRRYIMDLFSIEWNSDLAEKLSECAKTLQAPSTFKPKAAHQNQVGGVLKLGHLGRSRRASESDEEEEELDLEEDDNPGVEELPVISLRPVSKIVGFAA